MYDYQKVPADILWRVQAIETVAEHHGVSLVADAPTLIREGPRTSTWRAKRYTAFLEG